MYKLAYIIYYMRVYDRCKESYFMWMVLAYIAYIYHIYHILYLCVYIFYSYRSSK